MGAINPHSLIHICWREVYLRASSMSHPISTSFSLSQVSKNSLVEKQAVFRHVFCLVQGRGGIEGEGRKEKEEEECELSFWYRPVCYGLDTYDLT